VRDSSPPSCDETRHRPIASTTNVPGSGTGCAPIGGPTPDALPVANNAGRLRSKASVTLGASGPTGTLEYSGGTADSNMLFSRATESLFFST
jgi:hypothetical protein